MITPKIQSKIHFPKNDIPQKRKILNLLAYDKALNKNHKYMHVKKKKIQHETSYKKGRSS